MSKIAPTFVLIVLLGLGVGLVFGLAATSKSSVVPNVQAATDWRMDWALKPNFIIEMDSQGFELPTSIAFVNNPGARPDDPLYFVTELLGSVKVVTNDRTVHTFAENLFDPTDSFETGLGSICLDALNGYVFVTIASPDEAGILRNDIIRFQSRPRTFSLTPESQVSYTDIFDGFRSGGEHQIGPCKVEKETLYVGVGDGSQITQSQQLDSVLGKVLRMTLDGSPVHDNPFFVKSSDRNPENYVWAYGLRNPFGMEIVNGRLFLADNGPSVDRFLEVKKGTNYLWDGSDASIGTNSDYLAAPGEGVAQMVFNFEDSNVFPQEFANSFFMTITGNPRSMTSGVPAIQMVPYDFSNNKVSSVPKKFLTYRGTALQVVPGVAFGPDGLYFAAMFPNDDGITPIFKIRYVLGSEHPYLIDMDLNPVVLMNTKGCFACHTLNNNGGGSVGPVLDRERLVPRILGRLNSEQYANQLEQLAVVHEDPIASFKGKRDEIAVADGLEKVNLWLTSKIQEPRFDNINAKMPNLGLSADQSASIASYLSGSTRQVDERITEQQRVASEDEGFVGKVINVFPNPTRENAIQYVLTSFAIGLVFGGIGVSVIILGLPKWRR